MSRRNPVRPVGGVHRRKWRGRGRDWAVRALVRRDGAVCGVCGEVIADMRDLTIDHILPTGAGGLDEIENMQLAHDSCNRRKGDALQ